jgi:hypothetical protein
MISSIIEPNKKANVSPAACCELKLSEGCEKTPSPFCEDIKETASTALLQDPLLKPW